MMSKRQVGSFMVVAALVACASGSSFAAISMDNLAGGGSGKSGVVEPSQDLPPLPEPPPVRRSSIPPLPVSRVCAKPDIEGLWKLQRVYEEPLGMEVAAFKATPMQYLYFRGDGTYGKYSGEGALTAPAAIIDYIGHHTVGLQQYLLQDTGLIYYYQDKIASNTQTCFIVVQPSATFALGSLLLMPPKGQINGRLIKQYSKVEVEVSAAATPVAVATPNETQAAPPAVDTTTGTFAPVGSAPRPASGSSAPTGSTIAPVTSVAPVATTSPVTNATPTIPPINSAAQPAAERSQYIHDPDN